MGQGEGRE